MANYRLCMAEQLPKEVSLGDWTDERRRHHRLQKAIFQTGEIKIVCDICSRPYQLTGYFRLTAEGELLRQATCGVPGCPASTYILD